jgi:hypothetical protein
VIPIHLQKNTRPPSPPFFEHFDELSKLFKNPSTYSTFQPACQAIFAQKTFFLFYFPFHAFFA